MSVWRVKVVLITGSSAGLGLELARQFCELEATVFILARNAENLQKAHGELSAKFADIHSLQADVTDSQQAADAIAKVLEKSGKLDVLINNVGK